MVRNPVRKALLERRVTLGSWIQIGHAAVSEIMANAGYEWLAVDAEHTDIEISHLTDVFRGMSRSKSVPFVRVRQNDTFAIRQALDCGAMGVIVPLVSTAEEAQRAVAAAKYPPEGVRGYGFCRANNYGADFDAYASSANDNVAVVVMIESKQAVENIDEILRVPGVDGVFVGPYDMSGSYGIPGQTDSDRVQQGCRKVVAACERAGKSAGLHVVMPTETAVASAIAEGFTFIAIGVDTVFLSGSSADSLQIARRAGRPE